MSQFIFVLTDILFIVWIILLKKKPDTWSLQKEEKTILFYINLLLNIISKHFQLNPSHYISRLLYQLKPI